jgi:hypothetical protein
MAAQISLRAPHARRSLKTRFLLHRRSRKMRIRLCTPGSAPCHRVAGLFFHYGSAHHGRDPVGFDLIPAHSLLLRFGLLHQDRQFLSYELLFRVETNSSTEVLNSSSWTRKHPAQPLLMDLKLLTPGRERGRSATSRRTEESHLLIRPSG